MKLHTTPLKLFLLGLLFAVLGMTTSVSAEPTETLTIAAANSLREALRNVLPLFEAQYPHVSIRVSQNETTVIWIPITVAAAGFQTARTALQHRLRALLSVSGAGFVRYLWGAPLAFAAVVSGWLGGAEMPSAAMRFWPTIAAAGLGQILGTITLSGSATMTIN